MQWNLSVEPEDHLMVAVGTGAGLGQADKTRLTDEVSAHPACDVILSLDSAAYASSSSLATVLSLQKLCTQANRSLVLVADHPAALSLIQLTRLDKLLTVVPNEREARLFLDAQRGRKRSNPT